jgi:protein tyrosine kinase
MPLALRISSHWNEGAAPAPQYFNRYMLLNKLPGGIRTELWLGLSEQADGPDEVVLLKSFFPHAAGPTLDGLRDELELAGKLAHDNIVRTSSVGVESGRHFLVNEYLEGTTLRALLRGIELSGVRLSNVAVIRLLMAMVAAVDHAERVSSSIGALRLSRQAIAVDDVFITYDGRVKLLGFKSRLPNQPPPRRGAPAANPESAVDALLSGHLSPELAAVLLRASSSRVHACDRLWQVGEVLQSWQTEELGGDGRSELVAIMSTLPAAVRLEQRARLDAALDAAVRNGQQGTRTALDSHEDQPAPLSGVRRVQPPSAPWAKASGIWSSQD